MIYLTASSLANSACHQRWHYQVVDGLRPLGPPEKPLVIGGAVHRAVALRCLGEPLIATPFEGMKPEQMGAVPVAVNEFGLEPIDAGIVMAAAGAFEPPQNIAVAHGKPAVELYFEVPAPFVGPNGEPVAFAGTLDVVLDDNGVLVILDHKTTSSYKMDDIRRSYARRAQFRYYYWAVHTYREQIFGPQYKYHQIMLVPNLCHLTAKPIPRWSKLEPHIYNAVQLAAYETQLFAHVKQLLANPQSRQGFVNDACDDCPYYPLCHGDRVVAMWQFEKREFQPNNYK